MARDYFDESKKKKKDEKKTVATSKPQSSVSNVAKKSTFLGGGASVQKAEERSSSTSTSSSSTSSSASVSRVNDRASRSTFMGGTETRPSSSTSSTRAREAADNAIERSRRSTYMGGTERPVRRTQQMTQQDRINQKSYGTTQPKLRTKEQAQQERTERRTLAQAQKSGDFEKASELRDQMYGSSKRRTQVNQWDKDIADTITHTVKQGLAGDARVLNRSMQGITQKDAFLYTTQEQRNKADAKVAARDKRLAQTIENETQALEDIQNKHGYIGKQALSAVSSVTGMGMDIAAGAVAPGSSLAHMWMRSTGTSMGQVNRKAENLRRQLKATGQYTDRELDEMFSNVDALDMANAAASGGIEVLSELLFPGVGAARKVIGGKGMSLAERAGAKLFNKVGAKASGGFLKNLLKGTAEEVAEEEIGGPLQALSSNLIYGNKFQGYQEDSIKKSLTDQSNALRSQVHSEEEARAAAARLSSQTFMDDSTKMYQESGYSKEESERLAELSREYLTASLSGDVDAMKQYQDEMVAIMAGGENSQKEKFTFQDAIDAAVSTSMMTLTTGLPGAISTMQVGNAYKENAGLNAVKQQAEMIRNWGEEKDKAKAQAIIDHIDNGGDLSGTQVYEIIQKSGELAEENREPERIKNQIASAEMGKRDLRISPISQDGVFAPQTQQRYEQIVNSTIARYDTLAKIGEDTGFDKTDVAIGANIGAAFETGVITSEMVNELATGSAAVKAVFEDVTGINLEQFDSYTEMNHALMAEAAQNMVNSARLEQAAWNDESRKEMSDYITKDVGGSGDLAVQNALEAVDPRDRTMFLMTGDVARSVYDYARKTDASWSEVRSMYKEMYPSVNYDSLEDVYKAAKQDKQIAETNGYGKIVGNNTKNSLAKAETAYVPGKYTDARQVRDGGLKEESLLKSIARAFGINVKVVDDLGREAVDKDGNAVVDEFGDPVIIQDNGYYDSANNTLVINAHPDATRTITQTMSHELTHHIAVHAPNEYVKLNRYIMDAWYRQDPSGFNRAIEQKQAQYKRIKNQDLSVEQALEEIIADGAADFNWADEQFIQDVTVNDPTLADRIIEAIKDVLRRIREILASGDVIDEASREALYDKAVEFSEVQKLWMNAAQAARKERASQAIDEWQDNANRASIRTTNDVLANRDDTAIFIKNTANADYIDMVFKGKKTEETRAQRTLDAFIGKEVAVTDGKKVYGTVVLGEPHQISAEEFHKDENQRKHRVPKDDDYDVKEGKSKWAYPIESYTKYEEPRTLSKDKDYLGSYQARQTKYSVSDSDYMDAVEEYQRLYDAEDFGFIKAEQKLQKMVDEVAIQNGYTLKAYHGTNSEPFNVFDRNHVAHGRMHGDGFYFSPYEEVAGQYGQDIREYYLKTDGLTEKELGSETLAATEYKEFPKSERDAAREFYHDKMAQFSKYGQGIERYRPESKTVNGMHRVTYTTVGAFQNGLIMVATEPEYIKSADPITYDDSGNVIPLSQRFDETSEDIRFSLSEPVERVKDLIAVHNLKPEDIRNTFELGGFPMPSIAITKDSMGHDMYGDISLLFGSDTIDPKFFRSNQVFGGDAWTPTFPATRYKPNEDIVDKFRDIYYDNAKTLGYDAMRPFYELAEDAENALNRDGGEQGLIDKYKNDIRAMRTFLKMNGKDVEDVVKTTEDTISETEQKLRQHFIDTLGEDAIRDFEGESIPHGKAMMEHRKNWTADHSDEIKSAYKDFLSKEFSFSDEQISNVLDNMNLFETMKLVRNALNYLNNGATTVKEEVDRAATDKAIKDAAHELGYEEWIEGLLTGIEEKRGIRNDKEYFTRNGNRRSWESLHDEITLDNVVKVMRAELAAGGTGIFGSNPKGAAQKQYKSLDEIRADEDRLQDLPEEEYKALSEEAVGKMAAVCSDIAESNPKSFQFKFGAALDVGSDIAEILNTTRDRGSIQRKLKNDYLLDVTEDQMDDLMEAIDAIANLPTGYFEAKPRRAVNFDEVKAAIVPTTMDEDIKQGFADRGIQTYEYDSEVEGDRARVLNEAATEQDVRFSIAANLDEPYMSAVESGNMDEAQRLVDEAARMAGMRVAHRFHGTMNANFTVFDKAYAKVGGNSGAGFYFSTEEDDSANHYADVEGADNYYKWSELAEAIWDTGELPNGEEAEGIESYEDAVQFAKDYLNRSPGTFDVYLNYKNPYVRNFRQSTDILPSLYDDFDESLIDRNDYDDEDDYYDAVRDAEYEHIYQKINDAVYGAYYDLDNFYEIIDSVDLGTVVNNIFNDVADYERLTWDDIAHAVGMDNGWMEVIRDDWSQSATADIEFVRAIVENFGYDAIEDKEVSSKFGQLSREMMTDTEHIIVFKPEQIKLSDPVTYAEDGSVIPLSERFDPNNDDIRYSLPTTDTEGNVLTDGQMEYFKNSQARDEQGRLVPVYHTTNRGGFTIFDPWYSNDHRSLFFASNWDVSQTYGYRAGNPINLNPGNRIYATWAEVENDIRKRFPEWLEVEDMISPFLPQETMKVSEALNAFVFRKQDNQYADELGVEDGFDNWIEMSESGEDTSDYYVELTIPKAQGFVDIQADNLADLLTQLATELETGQGKQRGYYSVYLNLENPMIVDAQGQNWDAIPYGEYSDDAVLAIKNLTVQDMGNGIYVNIWGDRKVNGEWEDFRESDLFDYETSHDEIPDAVWDNVYDFLLAQGLSEEVAERYSDATFYNFNGLDTYDKDGKKVESAVHRYRTRDLARIAQNEGHDGVIIKNCYDLGGSIKHGANPMSDIYIAFSSNQVKDINNENPTENPDIRYSMASEDETLGYLMQNAEDITDIPLADALLEDNRVRYALSATDFENSIITSWDRRTRNLAEEVQETPLKNELIRLMRQVRKDSGTERQYKSETIEETIRSLKKMYYYAKGDKAKEFAREAWDAAERIVDDIDYNDELYKQYQGITDYFANYRINLSEDIYNAFGNYKNDEIKEDFEKFIKDSSGKIRFSWEMFSDRSDDVELHYAYNKLSKEYPDLFPSDKDNPIDQLLQMDYVLNLTDPYRDAYTSEEHSKLVEDIANNLCNIVDEGNEYKAAVDDLNVKAMNQRHQEAIRKIKEVEKQKRTNQIERAEKWKARYNERVKQNQADKEAGRQKKNEKKLVGDIEKNIKWLSDRLRPETRTKDNAIPEQFRSALGALLAEFDLQTKGSKKLEKKKGYPSKVTLRMRNLRDQYEAIAKEKDEDGDNIFRYNGDLLNKMDQLIKTMETLDKFFDKNYGREVTIADLSLSEMFIIDTMLKSLVHEFREYKNVTIENKRAEIADVSSEVMGDMDTQISRHGQAREGGALGKISGLLNMAEVTPVYFFKRLGAMYKMYRELRKGFDKYIENDREVINRLSKIMSGYYNKKNPGTTIESWRTMEDAQTFNFEHGSVTLSVAQMMEIYLYANRPQAYAHLTGDGIIVSPITPSGKIANAKEALLGHEPMVDPVRLSYEDIQEIVSKLTEEQINMANKLQELVAGYMSDLGNETTMKLYGYKMFDDPNYFGIHVSQTATSSSVDAPALTETIKNFGWTKPLAPGAKNAMVIGDIFTDVARYCNEMNQFNAYAVPVSDFMRVYNYKQRDEEGNFTSVKGSIQKAFGKQAHTYIMNFLRDLNGASMRRNGGLEGLIDSALGKAKKAAVFMNMRVALQQPTAIVRALAQMNAKYFVGVRPSAAATKEMIEHCPIAQWKAWGFYDTHFGRDVEDLIMNNWSKADVVGSWIYGALDNMTWGMIWQAVKKEVKADIKARNLDVKEGSQEFWDMCNDRASFVFDSTQVVDSPFHRSDAMRSKDTLIKQFTSFQAEPTLSFNVVRDFFVQAYDAVADGDKGKAAKLIARGVEVWTLQAAVVAVAQSLWDAVRHKHPDGDDDEEEKFLMLWWENFMSDFVDDMKLYNNIYFIKEFTPYAEKLADYMKTGKWSTYDNNKLLMFQGAEKMAQGLMQIMKKIQKGDDYKHKNGEPYTWYEVMTSFLGGVGYLFGVPAGTVMRDAASILEWFNIKAFAADTIEKPEEEKKGLFERAANKMGYRKKEKDAEASEISYDVSADDLPGNLTDEQKEDIVKAGERRAKKNADKEEEGQLDYDTMLYKAMKASAGLEGEDFNKAVYSSVAQGLKGYVADGDYQSIGMMRTVIEQAGGDVDYFDSRVLAETKSAYKKTLNYDQSVAEYNDMRAMYRYMANHGMSQEDISAIVYESDMAKKDLKVAYILGDEGLIAETMTPLLNAGISRNDLEKIYKNRNRIDLMKYKENGGRYAEKLKSRGTFIWPTQGTITSHFGYRNAPTRGASSNHPAIDIGAPQGTSVVAADGGVVISAGANGGYGNSVGIKHDNGMITWYNHLYSWNVKEGDTVAQGQQIAQVGSTGISTGPHLDFKIMDANGEPVDPEQYLQ